MATVTSYTKDHIDTLVNALVQTGRISLAGNLILTTHDGTDIDLGPIGGGGGGGSSTLGISYISGLGRIYTGV